MTIHRPPIVPWICRQCGWLYVGLLAFVWSGHAFDLTHAGWTSVLQKHTTNGMVDYDALEQNSDSLDSYLASFGEIKPEDFKNWKLEDQLASLINLYNAATIRLIIDEYPVKSIKDIGILPHAAWRKKFVLLWGDRVSLNHIEHELIRPLAKAQPDIHFALVCAAKGCPPLRGEAYVGKHLIKQLHDQGVKFLSDTTKNRVNQKEKILHLSPIFDWYAADFELNSGSVNEYLTTSFPELIPAEALHFSIKLTEYDWSLNEL